MQTISSIRRAAALLLASAVMAATPAAAQLHDHLECYKVGDTPTGIATVDLSPSEVLLPADSGCTIKLKSKQVCFPVAKSVLTNTGGELDVSGQDLSNAFLCYAVKCPSTALPASLQMSDQFGTRSLTKLHTSTVCTPAVVGVPVTTTVPAGTPRLCADATAPNCDGTCGNYNYACVADAGACICQGQEPFAVCGVLSGPPNCYGTCTGSQSCIEVSGACQCAIVNQ